jgi:3D (Asp-Asp-Asp) domain-containing protein
MKGISHSLWRKLVATFVVAAGFIVVYQATIRDSRNAAQQALSQESRADPGPGVHLRFQASAYCKGEVTASGLPPRSGIAAADPDVLPTGSVIQVTNLGAHYDGIYTIMDTGSVIKGRLLDIYMWSCDEARQFGRRSVQVFVLRLGWNPRASEPSLFDTLLPWRERPAKPPGPTPARPPMTPPATAPQTPKR